MVFGLMLLPGCTAAVNNNDHDVLWLCIRDHQVVLLMRKKSIIALQLWVSRCTTAVVANTLMLATNWPRSANQMQIQSKIHTF